MSDFSFYCVPKGRHWWQRLMFWRTPKADQWTPQQIEEMKARNCQPIEINRVTRFYDPVPIDPPNP